VQLVDESAVARGMVRVDRGEDLLAALAALARLAGWRDAYVTGTGTLALAEVRTAGGSIVTLEDAAVASLSGRLRSGTGSGGVELHVALLGAGALHVGRLLGAVTEDLLLVVEAVAGDRVVLTPDAGTHPAAPRPEVARPIVDDEDGVRAATKPLSQSFTTKPVAVPVAPASGAGEQEEIWAEVEAGDYLDHPQLGFCEVVGDDGSGGTRVRVPSGRVRVLRLDALQIMPAKRDDEGRRVFRVAGPRARSR
jgi:predicted DNA-binding protein with PD1-like motif